MSVSFAGSRSLDARRRRRLATDQLAPELKPRTRGRAKKLFINPIDELQKRVKPRAETPIHAIIPSRMSRFVTLNAILVGLWLLLLTLSATCGLWSTHVSPRLSNFFAAGSGSAWPLWTGLTFLLTSQASWLVYWYRRHSRRDFHGHYRIWLWTSVDWAVVGLGALTGLHQLVAETLVSWTRLPRDPYENLLWMAPLAGILVNLGHGLDREMASSKVSWRMLCLALTASLLVGMTLIGWSPLGHPWGDQFFMTVLSTFVPLALMIATLNQLYFVLYVTSESVQKEGGMLSSAGKRVSASTSKFVLGSLLTTGWLFKNLGHAYKLAMSLLFSLLLWKKIEVDAKKGKKPKPKPKAKPVTKAATTPVTRSRGRKIVDEEPAQEQSAEEDVSGQEESHEVDEEDDVDETTDEENSAEDEETTEDLAAEPEEAWNQSAWEAEMQAFEEEQRRSKQPAANKLPAHASQASRSAVPKLEQKIHQTHAAHAMPVSQAPVNQRDDRWNKPEEKNPRSNANMAESDEDDHWQDGDSDDDTSMDTSEMRGMSKKERRRLRKQMRDQQRGRP